ncbi:MAG TPA: HAMP domain-containing sensor histidine kinase [Vicinamibacteria bacterium]|nr:HAMP domain-containing sensor histidine kinase [Vicinamibacteria bacterium]
MGEQHVVSMGSMGLGPVSNEVLAVVTHDLRNPLNVIAMGASLLDGGEHSDEERAEILRTIKRATDRMERLLADLLSLARLQGGRTLPVQPEAMDLSALLEEVYEAFSRPALSQGRRLEYRIGASLPDVYADRDRIHQVLANLVGNALKFTPRGGAVTMEAEVAGGEVRCSVRDTGPGMTEEEMERLFDPFWQAEKTARFGFGLGLKIAKCIVEAHGGSMYVDSVWGSGSSFSFTLPLADGQVR